MGYYDEMPELDINSKIEDMELFDNVVLLDVREPEEYAEGHIPGAVNLDAKYCNRLFKKRVEAVLPDKTARIYMYCYSGARSGIASAFLRQMGYTRAENIGGFESYTGPTEK